MLTKDNYIRVSNKSSFEKGRIYNDQFIKDHIENCLYNFDVNMRHFNSLNINKFNKELMDFISKNKFKEVKDLSSCSLVSGYYIMVLDDYCQAYIGRSHDIRNRILVHWRKQKEFDRLVFGGIDNSILSIDSFRALDTTRIFVFKTNQLENYEDKFINSFDAKYLLNRTKGGTLSGLIEAISHRKTRNMPPV